MKKIIAGLFCFMFLCASFNAASAEDVRRLTPSGFVNDYAGILSPGAKSQITGLLQEVERRTSAEVTIVTVNTTTPFTIEQYAVELFQKWGIGKKGADNGILVLVAVRDRKARIEVGYGLEGAVTDLQSKLIIEDLMVPAFRKGDYDMGISAATVMLAKLIAKEYNVQIDLSAKMASVPIRTRPKKSPLGSLFTLLFFILIFGFRFGSLFFIMGGSGGYYSGGSSGSFGGGFGGFGGGMSGGGGASGGW